MAIPYHTKFISLIAAISIGITALGASQAEAGNRDTERALAALLGLAVIGAVIADERKKDRRREKAKVATRSKPVPKPPVIDARPLPDDLRRVSRNRLLPERCLRFVETGRGQARYFGARCMNRNFKHVNKLPRSCERRIRTDRGIRYGWGARCLRREGYTLARR